MAGFFLGTVTALAISPAIMVASSWDAIFHFFSVAGAAVLALWLLFAEDLPPTHRMACLVCQPLPQPRGPRTVRPV